jgi:hypothetical protein
MQCRQPGQPLVIGVVVPRSRGPGDPAGEKRPTYILQVAITFRKVAYALTPALGKVACTSHPLPRLSPH